MGTETVAQDCSNAYVYGADGVLTAGELADWLLDSDYAILCFSPHKLA